MPIFNQLTSGTDMSQEVYEANRPYYNAAYSALDRAKQIAASQVKQTYGQAIGETYLQGQQSQAAIGTSALGKNYKTYLQNQLNQNIQNAYNNYMSQQNQALEKATSAYDTAMSNITSGIQEAGQTLGAYRDRYASGAIEYGANLVKSGAFKLKDYNDYNAYTTAEEGIVGKENLLSEEDFLKQKRQQEVDWMKFEGLYNNEGNINWDAVKTALYAKRNEAGEVVTDEYGNALIDNSGELSTQGQDIFDYLMRYDQKGFENYQSWLSKNDKDLYEWSIQRSILNDPTNAYTAMKTLGADGVYNFVERFGGLTEKQTEKVFSNFKVDIKELSDNKENFQTVKNTVGDIKDFYKDLGLSSIEITMDGKTSTVDNLLDQLGNTKDKKSWEDVYKDFQKQIEYNNSEKWKHTGMALGLTGAAAAAAVATVLFPPLVLISGTLAGVDATAAITEGALADYYNEESKKEVINQRKALQDAFDAFALQSATLAKELRKQTIK